MSGFKGKTYRSHDTTSRKLGGIPRLSPGFIRNPVGISGLNKPGEVYRVQRLLNMVAAPGIVSGKMIPLKPDGNYGSKTRDRIISFQQSRFGASDGLVEIDGPTIRSLLLQSYSLAQSNDTIRIKTSSFIGGPVIPDGDFIDDKAKTEAHVKPLLTDTDRIKAAVAALPEMARLGAASALTLTEASKNPGGSHALLFRKHFRRSDEIAPLTSDEISIVAKNVQLARSEISRRQSVGNGDFRGVSVGSYYDGRSVDQIFALTWTGAGTASYLEQSRFFSDTYTKEIWLGPRMDYLGLWYFAKQLYHEIIHYVGGTGSSGKALDDQGYYQMEDEEAKPYHLTPYGKMTAMQRRKNADTYAAYALEALHGTDVLKKWRNNPAGEFDRPPYVTFKGVLFGGDIIGP